MFNAARFHTAYVTNKLPLNHFMLALLALQTHRHHLHGCTCAPNSVTGWESGQSRLLWRQLPIKPAYGGSMLSDNCMIAFWDKLKPAALRIAK